MRTILLLAFLVSFLYVPALAEETEGNTQFRSFINGITCGQIVEGLDKEESRNAYVLMIGSFITGTNYAKNRDSKTDLKGMLLLTEQFCRQNPERPILTAMIFLDNAIDRRNEATQ